MSKPRCFQATAFGCTALYFATSAGQVRFNVANMLHTLDYTKTMREAFIAIKVKRVPNLDSDYKSLPKQSVIKTLYNETAIILCDPLEVTV